MPAPISRTLVPMLQQTFVIQENNPHHVAAMYTKLRHLAMRRERQFDSSSPPSRNVPILKMLLSSCPPFSDRFCAKTTFRLRQPWMILHSVQPHFLAVLARDFSHLSGAFVSTYICICMYIRNDLPYVRMLHSRKTASIKAFSFVNNLPKRFYFAVSCD